MLRVVLLIIGMVMMPLVSASELEAVQWLQRMTQAMKRLNYQGTVAFFKNGRVDTMKYFHATDHSREQEGLVALNSPMREVIREAGKVSCVFQEPKHIVIDHRPLSESFILDLPANFVVLDSVYRFSLGEQHSVAMRPVRIVRITAKDNYRFDRKIWIDEEYFLPLKVEVYDLTGVILEQVVFTDIQVGGTPSFFHTLDSIDSKVVVKHIHQLHSTVVDNARLQLDNVPYGFEVVFSARIQHGDSTQFADHLLLSDGFSSISVYREPKNEAIKLGAQTLGSLNSFTHEVNGYQITVMGEVPVKTVQQVAQGVTFH